MVAESFFPSPTVAGFASGAAYPDALSGAADMAGEGPLVLVPPGGALPISTTSYLSSATGLTEGYLFGGTSAVGDDVASEIASG